MSKLLLSTIIFLIAISNGQAADDIRFSASAKNNVVVGERFQVIYTVNQKGTGFTGPNFRGFRVLTGPNVSTSQNYSIVNGKMSQSVIITYTYFLQALSEGNYTITPARITIDGDVHKSNSFSIEVVKRSSTGSVSPTQRNNQSTTNRQNTNQPTIQSAEDDVYIRAFTNKTNPFLGQQIIVTYKIFTTIPISQLGINKLSSFQGFWSKDLLNENKKLQQYREQIKGVEYVVADVRKIALFPQKAGKLVIDPMELQCLAQIRKQGQKRVRDPFFDSFFDDPFFNNFYQNIELTLESNSLNINVKPLPFENKPADFSGGVGNFSLRSTIDNTEIKANEPITIKYILSGSGNIELINSLNISFPPDFEVYDPKITNNIKSNNSGVSGTRVFEYLVIPRNAGDFVINPVVFSYFNPVNKTYKSIATPEYNITVEKGDGISNTIAYSGVSQADIQYIGSDIRHIKSLPFNVSQGYFLFLGSDWFFILLGLPIIFFLLIIFFWSRKIRLRKNVALVRNKKATKIAKKNLKKAEVFLKSSEDSEFYQEISRALWGYLSDKFTIPLSELSIETVQQKLSLQKIDENIISEFIETLNHTDYARFAPGDATSKMHEIYREALLIITKIERDLKS